MGSYLVESRTGRRWLVTPDGDLILTAEDREPTPPVHDLADLFDPTDLPDHIDDADPVEFHPVDPTDQGG
jgi:hypothetical protein